MDYTALLYHTPRKNSKVFMQKVVERSAPARPSGGGKPAWPFGSGKPARPSDDGKPARPSAAASLRGRPTTASPRKSKRDRRTSVSFTLVGMVGLEPMTSCMSSMRSNQLSYTPATACISYHFPSPLVNQIRGRFRFFCPFGEFCRRRPAAAGRRPSPHAARKGDGSGKRGGNGKRAPQRRGARDGSFTAAGGSD